MVDLVAVIGVTEVDFVGGDANNGACYVSSCAVCQKEVSFTVLVMQFIYSQIKPASV